MYWDALTYPKLTNLDVTTKSLTHWKQQEHLKKRAALICPLTPGRHGLDRTGAMTLSEYDELAADVKQLYKDRPGRKPQADFAGCVVRLAGHDLMDFHDTRENREQGRVGGSDGCLDFGDADNKGLSGCLRMLRPAFEKWCGRVSAADFVVVAAEALMAHTARKDAQINFRSQFRFGRRTNPTCEWAGGRLPNPDEGCAGVKDNFIDKLGLTWQQSAALMGVHTLGRASPSNSDFEGWWSDIKQQKRFNSNFFHSMLHKGWTKSTVHRDGLPDRIQWDLVQSSVEQPLTGGSKKQIMLTSDLCLAYDSRRLLDNQRSPDGFCPWLFDGRSTENMPIAPEKGEERIHCGIDLATGVGGLQDTDFGAQRRRCCGANAGAVVRVTDDGVGGNLERGPAFETVLTYADGDAGNKQWVSDFREVWAIVTTNGYGQDELKPLCKGACIT